MNRLIPGIRTITFSYDKYNYVEEDLLERYSLFQHLSYSFNSISGEYPRTSRISLPTVDELSESRSVEILDSLNSLCANSKSIGFRWLNLTINVNSLSL